MSLILNWLESMHLDFELTDRCSKLRNHHSTCGYCMDACQSKALLIQDKEFMINKNLCTSCGDCMIACPLSAITGISSEREFAGGSLIYKESFTPTVKELLIYKKRGIQSISATTDLNEKWWNVINKTNLLLKQLMLQPFDVVVKADSKSSRRAFLTSIKGESRKIVKMAAPAVWKMNDGEWILPAYYPGSQFYTVKLNKDKCNLCQACFSFCSQDVFHLLDNYIQIKSGRCVNCTDCIDICPEDALEVYFECSVSKEVQEDLFIKICQSCGESFKTFHSEEKECSVCMNRDPEWLSPNG